MLTNTQAQVVDLLQYLDTHEASTRQIERHIERNHGSPRGAHYLIWLARYQFGDDIVLCEYNYGRGEYIYRTARSAPESRVYVGRRARLARTHVVNCGTMTDRAIAKFPDEDAEIMQMVRSNLRGAVTFLDAVR